MGEFSKRSTSAIWPCAVELDPDQHSALASHPCSVVIPVGVFVWKALVVIDQRIHRLGKREHVRAPFHEEPRPKEAIGEHTDLGPRIVAKVARLVGRFPARNDRSPFTIHVHEHRALLDAAVLPASGEDTAMVLADEFACVIKIDGSDLLQGALVNSIRFLLSPADRARRITSSH